MAQNTFSHRARPVHCVRAPLQLAALAVLPVTEAEDAWVEDAWVENAEVEDEVKTLEPPAHVVMIVNNTIVNDNRVKKSALSLARAGLRVTLVGASATHLREETGFGSCPAVRVPVVPSRADTSPRGRATFLTWAVWRRVASRLPLRTWRVVLPITWRYEAAYGPELDRLRPDVIHVHDVHLLGVAVRAARRGRAAGRQVRLVYDAHEYVAGLSPSGRRGRRTIDAWADYESEFISAADRIITVSPFIAEELRRGYGLAEPPRVVLNAPVAHPVAPEAAPEAEPDPGRGVSPRAVSVRAVSVRAATGVGAGEPLLVYSGGLTEARGVDTLLEALPLLPGHHLAVVAVPYPNPYAEWMAARAGALGVADRFHVLAPVDSDEVVPFLASATVGVHPMLRGPNHDMALPNKLFEYLHAGLPLVVSDCPAMAGFVTEHGLGAVFRAGDAPDLARAVTEAVTEAVGADGSARRGELMRTYCWQSQERMLWGLYAELLGLPALSADGGWSRGQLAESSS